MFKKLALWGLWSAAAISGFIVSLRALIGPIPLHINSPMNAESCFGLAIVLILLSRANRIEEKREAHPFSNRLLMLMAAGLVVITAAAFWRTLNFYFLSDDFILVKYANSPLRPSFHSLFGVGGGDGFFRPIGNISMSLNAMWASFDPTSWHLSALAFHAANSLLVFALALKICSSRFAAFFAAALFAVHGTRPEAVAWIASRFDLAATFFVLCGLLFFLRSLSKSKAALIYGSLSLGCMILGILSKESAYIFPLLAALFMISRRDLSSGRFRILIPFFVVAAGLFAYRWVLFGGIGGYQDVQTGKPQALMAGFVPLLKALFLRLWAVLFFPINWSIRPGIILSILLAAYVLSLLWFSMSRIDRKHMLFPLGFLLISALPPLNLLLIGSNLQGSRLLYLPSVGFSLMLAVAADRMPIRMRRVVPGVFLIFNLFALEHNLNAWACASAKSKSACAAAVQCLGPAAKKLVVVGLPGSLNGVFFLANGFPECVELRRGSPFPVEFRKDDFSPSAGNDSSWLFWDKSKAELCCKESRNGMN